MRWAAVLPLLPSRLVPHEGFAQPASTRGMLGKGVHESCNILRTVVPVQTSPGQQAPGREMGRGCAQSGSPAKFRTRSAVTARSEQRPSQQGTCSNGVGEDDLQWSGRSEGCALSLTVFSSVCGSASLRHLCSLHAAHSTGNWDVGAWSIMQLRMGSPSALQRMQQRNDAMSVFFLFLTHRDAPLCLRARKDALSASLTFFSIYISVLLAIAKWFFRVCNLPFILW